MILFYIGYYKLIIKKKKMIIHIVYIIHMTVLYLSQKIKKKQVINFVVGK